MKSQLISLLILCVSFRSFTQPNQNTTESILDKFTDYQQSYPVEKVYLHLDKTTYALGEDIWFKAYLVDGAFHNSTRLSTLLYVDLINHRNQIIASRNIKIKNGVGIGDFSLADSLQGGDYTIRAYTEYMRNFDLSYLFRQKIKVININTPLLSDVATQTGSFTSITSDKNVTTKVKLPNIDVQFFPEGGHMIDGLVNNIAFKAINSSGRSINIFGKVINSKGETVADFKTSKFGMGKFVIIPKTDETYTAHVNYVENRYTFELPLCKPQGYRMALRRSPKKISITVNNNMGISMKNTLLIGHVRGVIFKHLRVVDEKDYFHITIPMDSIPSGIAHFTFFDQNASPMTERIVYVDSKVDNVSLEIQSAKNEYSNREKAEFRLSASDYEDELLQGNVSISIVNAETLTEELGVANIESYLLLSSDIKGQIENPNYYFNKKNKDRNEVLDLLMLTQGWRKFTWNEILQDTSAALNHNPENGFRISGQLLNYYNRKKPVIGSVALNSMDNLMITETVTTSENGRFSFEGLDINDSLSLILQANKIPKSKKNKNKNKEVKISKTNDPIFLSIDTHQSPEITPSLIYDEDDFIKTDTQAYAKQSYKIKQIDSAYFIKNNVRILDEVTIKQSKFERNNDPYYRVDQIYGTPNHRLYLDSIRSVATAISFYDVLRARVPGLIVQGTYPNQSIIMRGMTSIGAEKTSIYGVEAIKGNNGALIVLDGMPIDNQQANQISPKQISHIDILKGTSGLVYGIRGATGVVAVYTKRAVDRKPPEWKSWGIVDLKHPGYYKARAFYTPKYDENNIPDVKPDFRNTLYWNPEVRLDDEKNSKFEFYTSDEKATYLIQVQGISDDGKPVFGKSLFTVK